MNLLSCLSKVYVSTYVCKGRTPPNTKNNNYKINNRFTFTFSIAGTKHGLRYQERIRLSWHLRQALLLFSNKCKQNVLTSMKLL